jgi:hypothetical protein
VRTNPATGALEHYYEELDGSSASPRARPAVPAPVAAHPHLGNRAVNPPHIQPPRPGPGSDPTR